LSGEDGRNADMELTDVEGLKSGIEVFWNISCNVSFSYALVFSLSV
jgi:hypothetical protein